MNAFAPLPSNDNQVFRSFFPLPYIHHDSDVIHDFFFFSSNDGKTTWLNGGHPEYKHVNHPIGKAIAELHVGRLKLSHQLSSCCCCYCLVDRYGVSVSSSSGIKWHGAILVNPTLICDLMDCHSGWHDLRGWLGIPYEEQILQWLHTFPNCVRCVSHPAELVGQYTFQWWKTRSLWKWQSKLMVQKCLITFVTFLDVLPETVGTVLDALWRWWSKVTPFDKRVKGMLLFTL